MHSEGVPGGFLHRVKEGTWLGHVVEHLALELQTLAGMDMGFGRTRGTGKKGEYFVVFDYMEEDAGVFAAKSAVALAEHLVSGAPYDLEGDTKMSEIREDTLWALQQARCCEALKKSLLITADKHTW